MVTNDPKMGWIPTETWPTSQHTPLPPPLTGPHCQWMQPLKCTHTSHIQNAEGGRGVNWKWGPFPFKMPWRMSTKFVFLNVFILVETIYPKRWAKTFAKERKKSTLLTQSKRLYLSSLKIVRIQNKQSYRGNLPHAYDLYDQNRTTNAQ